MQIFELYEGESVTIGTAEVTLLKKLNREGRSRGGRGVKLGIDADRLIPVTKKKEERQQA